MCFRKSFISIALNIKDRHRGRQSFTNREFWENLCQTHAFWRKIPSLRRSPARGIKSRKSLFYRPILTKENREPVLMDWNPENLWMVEVAVKTANFLPASKRSQILQNGSLLQFNGKVLWRTVLRLAQGTAFRWITICQPQKEPFRSLTNLFGSHHSEV